MIKENNLNFGLIIEEKKRDTDYQLGAVEKQVLHEDGQWTDHSPECEIQKTDHDDLMDCTNEAKTNARKLIFERKFNISKNKSQRFDAKMSGTSRSGNTLFNVANSERKNGCVQETDWPRNRNMTWSQYYASIPQAIKNIGLKFANQYEINYEFVPTNHNAFKEALKYSPIQTTGYAWASENGIYHDYGYRPNHSFLIVGYVDGKYWIIYDSYPTDFIIDSNSDKQEFTKKLDWNFNFGDGIIYSYKEKANVVNTSLLLKLKNMFKNLKAYMDTHGLHIWYIDTRGKQEIPLETMAEKALFMSYVKEGIIPTTTYPAIAGLPNFKFF